MVKCKYCKHYQYAKRIECCHSHGEIQLGRCGLSEREYGCMTEAETEGCPVFVKREYKYGKGDVFIRDTHGRVIAIVGIQPEYSPNCYRVRDNRQCEYSLPEETLDKCTMILKGEIG